MNVHLRHPKRQTVQIKGPRQVQQVLDDLRINPETVIVIRSGELLTRDVTLLDTDEVEIRYAISGGSLNGSAEGAAACCA